MEPEKKSNGAFIGLVIIIIILLAGGIYVWQTKVKDAFETPTVPADSSLPTSETSDKGSTVNIETNVNAN